MSTSNSWSWNTTATEIINRALRICGVQQLGASASTNEYTNAKMALNALVKRISADGTRLWQLEEVVYTVPTASQIVGTDGSYYYCIKNHTSSSATYPISGAQWTDVWNLGGDTNTNAWVNATSYTSSNTLSLSGSYQGVSDAFYRENGVDYPLQIIPQQDYYRLDDKFVRCTIPSHIAVDVNLSSQILTIYPYPLDITGRIHINAVRVLQDFVNTTDNADFDVSWIDALTYMLAANLCDEYQKGLDERGYLQAKADNLYRQAKGNDRTTMDTMVVKAGYSVR